MPRPLLTANLAYLTADIPGCGGVIKSRPEDFLVEELPLYPCAGQGEHLYLLVEKRDRTTTDVQRRLAKLFHVRKSDVGFAGLKDKFAVTRQHFSIWLPKRDIVPKALERFDFTGLRLLSHAWHANKLRRGHLAGNRFVILLRGASADADQRAQAVLAELTRTGVPNYYGEQRFGYRQTNHLLGKHLAREQWEDMLQLMLGGGDDFDPPAMRAARAAYEARDYDLALQHWPRMQHHERAVLDFLRQGKTPQQALRLMDSFQHGFMLSALQSAIFNNLLENRLRLGCMNRLCAGDLAWKHDNGAVFAVDEATAALENAPQGRVASFAVSPSGPLWGLEMPRPTGQTLAWEIEALQQWGVQESDLTADRPLSVPGSRRPLRVPITQTEISTAHDDLGSHLRLAFTLPKGSFATTVLREIVKPETTCSPLAHEDDLDS